MQRFIFIILSCVICLASCNDIREARVTLAEADSIRSAGVVFDDSLRLAAAYTAFGTWYNSNLYPDDYAGDCWFMNSGSIGIGTSAP